MGYVRIAHTQLLRCGLSRSISCLRTAALYLNLIRRGRKKRHRSLRNATSSRGGWPRLRPRYTTDLDCENSRTHHGCNLLARGRAKGQHTADCEHLLCHCLFCRVLTQQAVLDVCSSSATSTKHCGILLFTGTVLRNVVLKIKFIESR